MNIDYKFRFVAFNPGKPGSVYTEDDAFVMCAKDKAVIPALEAYIEACVRFDCDTIHIASVTALLSRVRDYQATIESKVPDTGPHELKYAIELDQKCPECGVAVGELHIQGCEEEHCPACGLMYAECECSDDMTSRIPWDGIPWDNRS